MKRSSRHKKTDSKLRTFGGSAAGFIILSIASSLCCAQAEEPLLLRPVIRTNVLSTSGGSTNVSTNFAITGRMNSILSGAFSQQVIEMQLALVRAGISPGSIDGMWGSQTKSALRAFQQKSNLPVTGSLDQSTLLALAQLGSSNAPALITLKVSEEDLARLQPLGKTWLAKSEQNRLDYETILELMAETHQAHPNLVRRINPGVDWENVVAGTEVIVPNAEFPKEAKKAAFVRILLGQRVLEAFDENTNLVAHFPCSIAQLMEKRPVGELRVDVVAPNPNYTFNPDVFPESPEARELNRKLILQPGPNNPVGVAWIGLDRPGYGIHGTPRPEDVGRTESHGCFRLANWNAEFLLRLITVGTPVLVEN